MGGSIRHRAKHKDDTGWPDGEQPHRSQYSKGSEGHTTAVKSSYIKASFVFHRMFQSLVDMIEGTMSGSLGGWGIFYRGRTAEMMVLASKLKDHLCLLVEEGKVRSSKLLESIPELNSGQWIFKEQQDRRDAG